MSKKPKNRNKKHHPSKQAQSSKELMGLITTCDQCISVGYRSLHGLVKKYSEGSYRTTTEVNKLVAIDNYIKSAKDDLVSLDNELTNIKQAAKKLVDNGDDSIDGIVDSITLHQRFEDWTTSYQSGVTPTLLELADYLETLDPMNTTVETSHE